MDINYNITIRYDGMDSDNGEIELFALGESLKGIARIAATAGHFAITEKYSRHFVSHEVKVVAHPPKANCFSIDIAWDFVNQHQVFSGSFGVIISIILPYIFTKASERNKEMKLLKDSLDKAISELGRKDEGYVNRLIDVIEKMADDLKPSVKSAVNPIGKTCSTLTIKSSSREDTFNLADKKIICKDKDNELTESRVFEVLITELDLVTATCKVSFPDSNEKYRVTGKITDPQIEQINNPYSIAFAASEWLSVIAKAQLIDGELNKLFISDLNL